MYLSSLISPNQVFSFFTNLDISKKAKTSSFISFIAPCKGPILPKGYKHQVKGKKLPGFSHEGNDPRETGSSLGNTIYDKPKRPT